jgi:hypothetical protein
MNVHLADDFLPFLFADVLGNLGNIPQFGHRLLKGFLFRYAFVLQFLDPFSKIGHNLLFKIPQFLGIFIILKQTVNVDLCLHYLLLLQQFIEYPLGEFPFRLVLAVQFFAFFRDPVVFSPATLAFISPVGLNIASLLQTPVTGIEGGLFQLKLFSRFFQNGFMDLVPVTVPFHEDI